MNFTREPIIETIISAREGYKLSLKSSKTAAGEEYLVDAIEVVSFGGSFFYRCAERPKPFFLPACDYEIMEVRENRLLVKAASLEKAIKIAGGKDSSKPQHKPQHTPPVEADTTEEKSSPSEEVSTQAPPRQEQKRDKKRYRKKKGNREERPLHPPAVAVEGKEGEVPSVVAIPPVFSHLLRPPESLISESLQKKYRKDDSLTAPDVASVLTAKTEESPTDWIKTEQTTFTEEVKADVELISEPPPARERLEESSDDSLLHLSFPDFDDRY